jgi:hypothetical protein
MTKLLLLALLFCACDTPRITKWHPFDSVTGKSLRTKPDVVTLAAEAMAASGLAIATMHEGVVVSENLLLPVADIDPLGVIRWVNVETAVVFAVIESGHWRISISCSTAGRTICREGARSPYVIGLAKAIAHHVRDAEPKTTQHSDAP